MDDWAQFLSAFPQPGEIHTWLLNQGDYVSVHARFAEHQPRRATRPFVSPWTNNCRIPTPFSISKTAQNPVLHGLITLPGGHEPRFVPAFGPTPHLVLQGAEGVCLVRGCKAVGLVAQPILQGQCIRLFHHRRLWYLACDRFLGHQRQPTTSLPRQLQPLLSRLTSVLATRSGDPNAVLRGHSSILWCECHRLDTERVWYFRLTADDLYFIGSYPVLWPVRIGKMDPSPPESPSDQILFLKTQAQVLPEEADTGDTMAYGGVHSLGMMVYNPVTLAAVVVTKYHSNFLLHRVIEKTESAAMLVARLVFLTKILRPLRSDLIDMQTQAWIQNTVKPFLDEDAKRLFPDAHAAILGLADNLFQHSIPCWIADIQGRTKIPACAYPLLAIMSRPNREQWVPLWEGDHWVRLLAFMYQPSSVTDMT
jgi:hypothetical protein